MNVETCIGPELLSPDVRIEDLSTRWWCGQVVVRLRREVAWLRHLGLQDSAQTALDLLRHGLAKTEFYAADSTSRYLSDRLGSSPPDGLFSQLAALADLTPAEQFVLAMGVAARLDAALGPVFATCHGDLANTRPSLAIAQQLWDDAIAVLASENPSRPLKRLGLIDDHWMVHPILAQALSTGITVLPSTNPGRENISGTNHSLNAQVLRFAERPKRLEVVALIGAARADAGKLIASVQTTRNIWPIPTCDANSFRQWLVLAWIADVDVWFEEPLLHRESIVALTPALIGDLAVRLYLHVESRDHLSNLSPTIVGPVIAIPPLSVDAREAGLREVLGNGFQSHAIRDVAQDFRLEAAEVAQIRASDSKELRAACRMECSIDFQGLAELLEPRFVRVDLVLPPVIDRLFDEALAAIQGAARLYHDWDGAKLGEGGIPLLFAGVPGTGKTMAAEVIASETNLPLFRVDLSQIINKYIGETEKNLKRVFDAAERMRCILFFDEADALFGKRSEVKEANDRFANISTGYILQRMDTFSGVSILATNRRKDLDEAFSRRLRYIIEFPVPGETERQIIWERVFPPMIDSSDLDFRFLARQFQITGGHIRSIALNAALQVAARGTDRRINMKDVLIATKRELDKLNRRSGADAFGPYFSMIEELRT